MRGGASRVYIASRDEKSLKESADEFNSKGYEGKCIPLAANLQTLEGCEALAKELEKREKCLHVLVNNSGNNWGAPYVSLFLSFPPSPFLVPFPLQPRRGQLTNTLNLSHSYDEYPDAAWGRCVFSSSSSRSD
jgi:NAD(P)-dependent dehydrogenase (short-subunit alcohol dehydrogenase family)